MLIDVLRDFRTEAPDIHVRVSTMNERDIEDAVLHMNADVSFGLAAPYERYPPSWYYHHLSRWAAGASFHSIIHSVRERLRLAHVVSERLILYERGSTGRQHGAQAFHGAIAGAVRHAGDDEYRGLLSMVEQDSACRSCCCCRPV